MEVAVQVAPPPLLILPVLLPPQDVLHPSIIVEPHLLHEPELKYLNEKILNYQGDPSYYNNKPRQVHLKPRALIFSQCSIQ